MISTIAWSMTIVLMWVKVKTGLPQRTAIPALREPVKDLRLAVRRRQKDAAPG